MTDRETFLSELASEIVRELGLLPYGVGPGETPRQKVVKILERRLKSQMLQRAALASFANIHATATDPAHKSEAMDWIAEETERYLKDGVR